MRIAFLALATLLTYDCADPVAPADDFVPGLGPITGVQLPAGVEASAFQRGSTGTVPATVVGVRFTNRTTTPAVVEHGACSVAIWLYPPSAQNGPPAWTNFPHGTACILPLYTRTIEPGASYDLSGGELRTRIGDNPLAAGSYRARLAISRRLADPSAGLIVLDAGLVTVP